MISKKYSTNPYDWNIVCECNIQKHIPTYKHWVRHCRTFKTKKWKCHSCRQKGKIHSIDTKNKMKLAAKTKTLLFCTEYKRRQSISKTQKIRYMSMTNEERLLLSKKIINGQTNLSIDKIKDWRKKQSNARKLQMQQNGCIDKFRPSYNKHSIRILEEFAKLNSLTIIHAENNEFGEFHIYDKINKRTYYADAYDPIKNIWIEFDELHHYDRNGILKQQDIQRQQNIEKILNCKIIRIKQNGLSR
jgi:hypothetical protein